MNPIYTAIYTVDMKDQELYRLVDIVYEADFYPLHDVAFTDIEGQILDFISETRLLKHELVMIEKSNKCSHDKKRKAKFYQTEYDKELKQHHIWVSDVSNDDKRIIDTLNEFIDRHM